MTRTSYATPAFDGTAALKPRPGARLMLIEGGRSAATERAEMTRPLSVWQSVAFLVLGALLAFALCAASVLADELSSAATEGLLAGLPEQELVVHDGDSLWSIASSLDLTGVSTEDVASWIFERNALSDSMLLTGQTLVVPATTIG